MRPAAVPAPIARCVRRACQADESGRQVLMSPIVNEAVIDCSTSGRPTNELLAALAHCTAHTSVHGTAVDFSRAMAAEQHMDGSGGGRGSAGAGAGACAAIRSRHCGASAASTSRCARPRVQAAPRADQRSASVWALAAACVACIVVLSLIPGVAAKGSAGTDSTCTWPRVELPSAALVTRAPPRQLSRLLPCPCLVVRACVCLVV